VKKLILVIAALGATVAVVTYAMKKVNDALNTFQEDESEDLPEGVEGYDPTWKPNLPPEVQKVIDEALARFPEGWTRAGRLARKTNESEGSWDRSEQATQTES
jgi:hypothetical protein